jgi:nucleotide-binding universal stress UspA family protein
MRQWIRRLLVATDLSPDTTPLLGAAADLAQQCSAELVVLHVVSPDEFREIRQTVVIGLDEYLANQRTQLRDAFAHAAGEVAGVRFEVMEGEPVSDMILSAATRVGADMIIMGTHGRSGLRRAIVGSVAEEVLRRATVPVLALPSPALQARGASTPRPAAMGR